MEPLLDDQLSELTKQPPKNIARTGENEYINILYYLRILNKYKRQIGILMVVSAFIVLIGGLLTPKTYTSAVSFLFPSEEPSISGLGGIGDIFGRSTSNPSKRIIIALVKSRRMSEDITERFFPDMFKAGGRKKAQAIRMVSHMVNIYEAGEAVRGIIEVKSSNPQLSADISNFCAANLDAINEKVRITSDRPMVKVIDPAIPPIYPDSRNIKRNVLSAILLAAFGGSFLGFFREYFKRFYRLEGSNIDV